MQLKETVDENREDDSYMIEARKNKISGIISSLSDEELCIIIKEITDFKDSGILVENSNLAKIATRLHNELKVPYDIRMVEDDVLYEAARRFYNSFEYAEWIIEPGLLPKCSSCGEYSDDAWNCGGNYCHNCGKKMKNAR